MPDNTIWPPKPDLPDPLTEYDSVIAAKLAALLETKTGPNKIQLIKSLRDEGGMDLSQAYAAVSSYYARNGAPIQTRASRMRAWLGCLPPLFMLCFAGFIFYWMKRRDEILSQPHHHAAFHSLSREALAVCLIVLMFALLNLGIQVTRFRRSRQK